MNEQSALIKIAISTYRDAFAQMVKAWENALFTWQWWLSLALTVLPWLLFIRLRTKASAKSTGEMQHTRRLLCAGMLTLVLASLLDMTGIYLGLWEYHTALVPIVPAYIPWDWSVMPVTAMLFYLYLPRINPWIKAAVFSVIGAYAAEPLFSLLGLYETLKWEYWYSIPLYALVYMAGWLLYRRTRREPHSENRRFA